jgi:hypothetical protein
LEKEILIHSERFSMAPAAARLNFLEKSTLLLPLLAVVLVVQHGVEAYATVQPTIFSRATLQRMAVTDPTTLENEFTSMSVTPNETTSILSEPSPDRTFWEIGPTLKARPAPLPLTPDLQQAMETNSHPAETQDQLGQGVFITADWRKAWSNYESPADNPTLIDPMTGFAEYEITQVEGVVPEDLVGTLYRNGPGLFGRGLERSQHVLDADGLVYSITFPPGDNERTFTFRSRFVETNEFKEEREADRFLYRSTFGTGPAAFFDNAPKNGLNGEPPRRSVLSRVIGMGGKLDVKNSANTQVISFGGKVLALFEAGLPYALDPETLETIGEDTMEGTLKHGLPVKFGEGSFLENYAPDFLGGDAHTAHPNVCPKTRNLVGWHWAQQIPSSKGMKITMTEWSPDGFTAVASKTYQLPGCELAPHDMAMTENYVVLKVNALTMNQVPFILGVTGPAASLVRFNSIVVVLFIWRFCIV